MPIDEEFEAGTQLQALYSFIGNYIVIFQMIECDYDQILNYLHKSLPKETTYLHSLTNRQKIQLIRKLISEASSNGSEAFFDREWLHKFDVTMAECEDEADYRNSLVHSAFPYAGKYAKPAFRIGTKGKKGNLSNDFETLDKDITEKHLMRVARLSFKVGWIKMRCLNYCCCDTPVNTLQDNLERYIENIIDGYKTNK